ncbi:hypothetical protein [Microbacterium sp. H1-D42]|uniref:hypothetical protein n=1 Tax=Microbacterium sp. H1-D42 TaxID=2925844 RepID=UPI001F53CFB9|nr:hypothetical protein [Microbacterium sp. H1-D42]UNK70099.1 hypothetical protein MNR00_13135 [Microbacterium sp. H1-D42]
MNDVERASNQEISRRTVTKAMAWAAPAIAVAATVPLAAASCRDTTSFDDLTVGSSPKALTFQPSGVTANLAFERSVTGSGWNQHRPGWGDTGKVARTSTAPQWNYLEMQMSGEVKKDDWIELTITLSEPLTGLSFIIHDIDKDSWNDTVEVSPGGFTSQRGTNIIGSGTSADRFRPKNDGDTPISGGAGRVTVSWPGPVTVIKVRYVAGKDSSSNQHIGIGDLSYDACLPASGSPKARSLSRESGRVKIDATGEVPAPAQLGAAIDS